MATVLGVDGCPAGWFATILTDMDTDLQCYPDFDELWRAHSDAARILVDIPIGLPDSGTRPCDKKARTLLGSRGSSVFDAICRPLLDAKTYDDANARYRELTGKGLSKQAWHLRDKITEVDRIAQADTQTATVLRESHPELCFYGFNDQQPIVHSKKSDRGRQKRLSVLTDRLPAAEDLYDDAIDRYYRKDVRRDDIIDALVLAVTAHCDSLTYVSADPGRDGPWHRIYYPTH